MSAELKFLVWAIEYYRSTKNLSGAQVAELFARTGVDLLVMDNYYLYHIESPNHMVDEIDRYLEGKAALAGM